MSDLQDALGHFNKDKHQWYGWIDTKNGEVYSNLKLNDDTAIMPTEEEVNAKIAELQWIKNRALAYPSIPDQLDDIFHNGLDGWKATIQETKDKYPKP
jgi:hypothetical protein